MGGDGGPGADSGGGGGGGGGGDKGGPTFTRLFSKNEDVDRLNVEELRKLTGQSFFVLVVVVLFFCFDCCFVFCVFCFVFFSDLFLCCNWLF